MKTILVHAGAAGPRWCERLREALPGYSVVLSSDEFAAAAVDILVGWNPPPALLASLRRLRVIFALGAGVDALLQRDDLPPEVSVVRLLDAGMAEQMVEYALYGVLCYQRHMHLYAAQQSRGEWRPLPRRSRASVRVGVLGLGQLGAAVAIALSEFGYAVAGWSRSAKDLPGVECMHGEDAIDRLLPRSDVLINLLPSTPATRGLLSRERLLRLPHKAYLINAARGDQIDQAALPELLTRGHLSGAQLDAFVSEPLPAKDPLWHDPSVRITPHVAAITVFEDALQQILDNLQRLAAGEPMSGVVLRERGY